MPTCKKQVTAQVRVSCVLICVKSRYVSDFLLMKSERSLICFSLTGIWKKLRFVCYPWKLGGNAEQTCGVLHILFLEYHWAVQVGGIFPSYQVCTEQSGCSQELCKEDFDLCIFWKSGTSALAPEGKRSLSHGLSQPSLICQKLRQGWSLNVILPCCFIPWGVCCFEFPLLNEVFIFEKKLFWKVY